MPSRLDRLRRAWRYAAALALSPYAAVLVFTPACLLFGYPKIAAALSAFNLLVAAKYYGGFIRLPLIACTFGQFGAALTLIASRLEPQACPYPKWLLALGFWLGLAPPILAAGIGLLGAAGWARRRLRRNR